MDEEIKKLIEKNLELTEEIHKMAKRMDRYVTFQKVMSFVYFLIIIVPIILGFIYLPPLLEEVLGQYQELLNVQQSNSLDDLLKMVK